MDNPNHHTTKHYRNGFLLALLTVIIWSGNFVVAKGVSKQIPPFSLSFYRWAMACVFIIPFGYKKFMQEKNYVFQHKKYFFFAALTGIGIFNTFIYLAGHYTSAINMALIGTTSSPIFSTFLAAIFLKEYITKFRIAGMLVCLAGILFLLSQGSFQKLAQFHFGTGDVLILISAFAFGIYNIFVKRKPAEISSTTFLFVTFIVGVLIIFPFYVWENITSPAVVWNSNELLTILYLGLGNSFIGFLCWNAAIARIGAARTALFGNLIPIFSIMEAVIFLGEKFAFIHLISGALIVAGLVIANISFSKKIID